MEAEKRGGGDPPAEFVQVLNGSARPERAAGAVAHTVPLPGRCMCGGPGFCMGIGRGREGERQVNKL